MGAGLEIDISGTPTRHACPHREAVGKRWGDSISPERQDIVQGYLDRWRTQQDSGVRDWSIPRVQLTGADLYWIAGQAGQFDRSDFDPVVELSLADWAHLRGAHLEGSNLSRIAMDWVDLSGAHLERADLKLSFLRGVDLTKAHLEGADLAGCALGRAFLRDCHLERADLTGSFLSAADLGGAHLKRAVLRHAHLDAASLRNAHLEGADLDDCILQTANLRGAWLDSTTVLSHAVVDSSTRLGDIHWGGVGVVDLSSVTWNKVRRLGEERDIGRRAPIPDHEDAVRAYRQLAAQFRAQGMSEVADRFAFRAQVRQRKLLLRRANLLQWLGSLSLTILAGYGYRPGRTIFWYLAVITGFTLMYMQATQGWIPFGLPGPSSLAPLPWYEALILSVSSFHGRGFFQPLQSLGDPVAALAAIEAVVGLVVEISFIATFTQRFFGAK